MTSAPAATATTAQAPSISIGDDVRDGVLHVRFAGDWQMQEHTMPDAEALKTHAGGGKQHSLSQLMLELDGVGKWDTSLVSLLYGVIRQAQESKVEIVWRGVPAGVEALLGMALKADVQKDNSDTRQKPLAERLGLVVISFYEATRRVLTFIGELVLSFARLLKRKAYFRRVDFIEALADVGPKALPIVTLISFLVGLILAFVGAMQLRQFGAQIFVANLVGIAMAREMGGMMTAIIMAGRTGASYAARLGTMQVNEEVDALRTNGIEPMDFLTLPRVLALLVMMPVLAVYAMAIGILGGMSIGVFMLDLSVAEYWFQTVKAVPIQHFWAGLIKSVVFAFVVGIAGCYHGMRCGRSSEAVGRVTTTAVVSAIVFIILTDSLLTVVYDVIGF